MGRKGSISKTLWIACMLALVFAELFLLNFDYWINLTRSYAISNSIDNPGCSVLTYRPFGDNRPASLDCVSEYAVIDEHTVVGCTVDGSHFIADADGNIRMFSNEVEWQEEVARIIQSGEIRLVSVSRFQDPAIAKGQCIVGGLASIMICVSLWLKSAKRCGATAEA